MNKWKDIYNSRKMSVEDAVARIRSGDRVVIAHLVGAPVPIIEAMVENYKAYQDVEICHMLTAGNAPYSKPEYKGHFLLNLIFFGGNTRQSSKEEYADFTPSHFSDVPHLMRNSLKADVALIQVSPPDAQGYVSLGLSSDYTIVAARNARTVIAEVNARCPRVFGDTRMHVSEVECFVETNRPVISIPPTKITEIEQMIGGYCAELINDGACLQLGLGAIPDAVLGFMREKKDLGIHSEIIGDGVKDLAEAGIVNGSRKELNKGKIIATSLYGTDKLNSYAHENPCLELYPVDYTNDVRVISQHKNMISINSCVELDFMGQVCSEAIEGTQFSGIGGQVDFVRGAKMSEGGKSILTCYSTAKNDTLSRIVPRLAAGTPITTSRTDVDYVITEYGVAHLRGQSLRNRAKALIKIAHPKFRDELTEEFDRMFVHNAWKNKEE